MGKARGLEKKRGVRLKNLGLLFTVSIFLGSFTLIPLTAALAAQEWPSRAITINVATAAGGGVDINTRAVGNEMSKILGVPIVIVNMPGGGGGIAAHNTFVAPNDGYTWQAQGAQLRTMGVLGYHSSSPKDWYCLPTLGYTPAIVVREDSPYKIFPDLIKALKESPGKIPYGASYSSTSWAINMQLLRKATGLQGRFVSFNGSPATHQALLSGDVQFAMTGIAEHAELLKGKKIRALAVFDDKAHYVKGYGEITAITDFLLELKAYFPFPAWSAIALRADVPKPILKKIDDAYLKAIQTKSVKDFCENFYTYPMGVVGEEAQKLFYRQASIESWLLYEEGVAKKSPADFGIPKP
jgi:tripartite-type tricarboxylate transporter receptor subunit TctC